MKRKDFDLVHNILKDLGVSNRPVAAVGGFHNGGLKIAKFIKKYGCKIAAVSDDLIGIVDLGGNGGLNIEELISLKKAGKDFTDLKKDSIKMTKIDFLLRMEVDLLIPENVEEVLNESNAEDVRAKVVLISDDRQVTAEARKILEEKLIPVIPLYS